MNVVLFSSEPSSGDKFWSFSRRLVTTDSLYGWWPGVCLQVLDLLEDYMRWKGFPVERIDGRIRGSVRQVGKDKRFARP